MPYGDRTGPWGLGPMTGRRAGYCAGYPMPGYMNPYVPGFGRGRGFGFGWGRGRGFRWFWRRTLYVPPPAYYPYPDYPYRGPGYYPDRYAPPTRADEMAYLEDLAESLERELSAIRKRLDELSKERRK